VQDYNAALEEEIEVKNKVIIRQQKQRETAINKSKQRKGPKFVKMHIEAVQHLVFNSGLTPRLQLLVFQLASLSDWDGYICHGGKQLTITGIAKMFNTDVKHMGENVTELEKKEIVIKHKQGKGKLVQLSPIYFSRK
jgi:hypothetical protein